MNVLIIDDKPGRYNGFVEDLSEVDKDCIRFCASVKEAINHLEDEIFDLVVVDMMLPAAPWKSPSQSGGAHVIETILSGVVNYPSYIVGITAESADDPRVSEAFSKGIWSLIRTISGDNSWEARLSNIFDHIKKIKQQAPAAGYFKDVCVVTALRKPEFSALLGLPLKWSDEIELDSNTFARETEIDSHGEKVSVVGAICSKMGAVETALLCSKLIQKYRPRLLIMTGICAGIKKLHFGDVIIANPAWDWQSVKIIQDDEGNKTVLPALDFISAEVEVTNRLASLAEDTAFLSKVRDDFSGDVPDTSLQMRIGPMASGSVLVADGQTIEQVRLTQNKDILGLEMEAYAIYAAARNANRPKPVALAMKSVCDHGNYLKDDRYQRYAAYTSARCFLEFITRYGADLKRLFK